MHGDMALGSHNLLNTPDMEYARDAVAKIFCSHELRPGGAVGSGRVLVNHAALRRVSVNWIDYGREVGIAPVPFEDFYLIQIVRAGHAEIRSNNECFHVLTGEASISNPEDQLKMQWSQYCQKLAIRIEKSALERFAETWFGSYLPGPLVFERHLKWDCPQLALARGLIDLIVQDLEAGGAVVRDSEAKRHLEDSLFATLLLTHQHSLSGLLEKRSPAIPRAVKLAQDYIAAHANESVGITELAMASQVSARTLFENFKHARGVTPMQYLRRYRLDRVREELLKPGQSASVTEIAMRWNFEQLGRFASYYHSVFGEKPSDTLRRSQISFS